MKKNFIAMGVMLAATLTLTNCAKEIQTAPEFEPVPYTIYANASDTKTANEGLSTVWAQGDELSVFVTADDGQTYSTNSKFTLTDAETGQFDGKIEYELASSNDWYVLYPYVSSMETPANVSKGWTPVGGQAGTPQKQVGNSNMKHIAGVNYPMWGSRKSVSNQTLPSVTMTHATSLIAVNVTNNTDQPLVVKNITFTAPVDIVGTYFINFKGDNPEFTSSGDNYVSKVAKLTVADGEEIESGKSAKFYLAVKPFIVENPTFVLDVNGTEKELSVSGKVDFVAGSIKTLNFNYDKVAAVKESISAGTYWITHGDKYATPITSNYGYIFTVDGGYSDNVYTFTAVEGGFTIQQADGRYLYMKGSYNNFNVDANDSVDGSVWSVYVNEDGTHEIINNSVQKVMQFDAAHSNFAAYGVLNDGNSYPKLVKAVDPVERPVLNLSATTASVGPNATSYEFTIEANVAWTIKADTGVSVSPSSGSGDATVTASFAENNSSEAKEYNIVVESEAGNKTLTINQSGKSADGSLTDVLNREFTGITGNTYTEWSGKASTSGAVYAGQSAGGNESIQLRSSNSNSGIVTTTSGGYVKKVIVTWNSNTAEGRTLDVYGKSTAYSAATDLYSKDTQGTKLGSIVNGTTELEINGNYQYVGLRSASGAMYLTEIMIVWSDTPDESAGDGSGDGETVTIEDGDYWIIADGKVATPLTGSGGYLQVVDAVDNASLAVNAFTFTKVGDAYTIQDSNKKYYYQLEDKNSLSVSDADGGTDDYRWKLYQEADGYKIVNCAVNKYIQYSSTFTSYGSYSDAQGTLPALVLAVNPIEPEPEPENALTLSFADEANRTSLNDEQQVWEQNGVKLTNDKGASTNPVADYSNPVRFYKNSTITVESAKIEKIIFTCNSASYATALFNSIVAGNDKVTVDGNDVVVVLANSATSYSVKLTGGQVRMNSVSVIAD